MRPRQLPLDLHEDDVLVRGIRREGYLWRARQVLGGDGQDPLFALRCRQPPAGVHPRAGQARLGFGVLELGCAMCSYDHDYGG